MTKDTGDNGGFIEIKWLRQEKAAENHYIT